MILSVFPESTYTKVLPQAEMAAGPQPVAGQGKKRKRSRKLALGCAGNTYPISGYYAWDLLGFWNFRK